MGKTCKKCGYTTTEEDSGDGVMCPKCGAVYAKVEEQLKKIEYQKEIEAKRKAREQEEKEADARDLEERKRTLPKVLIHSYEGPKSEWLNDFFHESQRLLKDGYIPTSQTYAPGAYTLGETLLAWFLCFFFIGILIIVYRFWFNPKGVFTVVYELKEFPPDTILQKKCPKCAELVRKEALICRFCGTEF